MRILMINYEYPPMGGGGGVFTRDLAEYFAQNGHKIDVLTSGFKGLKKYETVNNVRIYRVPVLGRSSLHVASLISLLSFPIPSILKGIILINNKKYDIINTHFAVPTGPTGLFLSKIFKTPNILTLHGGDISGPGKEYSPDRYFIFRLAVTHVLKTADAIVAQSPVVKYLTEDIYAPHRPITLIPLGIRRIELEAIPERTGKGTLRLISMGTLKKVKCFDVLIKAFHSASAKLENIRLTLIGDGPERKYLEDLSEELGIKDRVRFTGWLNGNDKYKYLLASDIFILSSLRESFGIVLLDAMACGLPIIATDQGGQRDIIKESENGLLVPPNDPDKLASAIHELCTNDRLREQMGRANKKNIENYLIPNIAQKYLSLFQNIISNNTNSTMES